jgi:hypothetical protein
MLEMPTDVDRCQRIHQGVDNFGDSNRYRFLSEHPRHDLSQMTCRVVVDRADFDALKWRDFTESDDIPICDRHAEILRCQASPVEKLENQHYAFVEDSRSRIRVFMPA